MDSYNVIITEKALQQLEDHISYIENQLRNPQAAQSVWQDDMGTRKQLEPAAGSLRLCGHWKLRRIGYRSIPFLRHNYIMVYRIEGNDVYVDGVYHQLQDYEKMFAHEISF